MIVPASAANPVSCWTSCGGLNEIGLTGAGSGGVMAAATALAGSGSTWGLRLRTLDSTVAVGRGSALAGAATLAGWLDRFESCETLVGRVFAGSASTPGESVVAEPSSGTTSGGVSGVGGVWDAVVPTGVLCGGPIGSECVVSVAVEAVVGSVVAVGFGVVVFGIVLDVSPVLGGSDSSGLGGSTFAGFSTSAGG